MIEPLAKIGSLDEDNLTAADVREAIHKGEIDENSAREWAANRLIAGRGDDARTVMRLILSLNSDGKNADNINTSLCEWEYRTALQNGNLGLGLQLHAFLNAYQRKSGQSETEIRPNLLSYCGTINIENNDLHNAIASFQRSRDYIGLVGLKHFLQSQDLPDYQRFIEMTDAAIADLEQ